MLGRYAGEQANLRVPVSFLRRLFRFRSTELYGESLACTYGVLFHSCLCSLLDMIDFQVFLTP